MMTDWARIRRVCLRAALSYGAAPADAEDVAQEAVVRTMLRAPEDPESYARRAAGKLTMDVLRARGRRGLTTGHGIVAGHGVSGPQYATSLDEDGESMAVTPADQEDVAIAHETRFALLVASGTLGALGVLALTHCRTARHRYRLALRGAWEAPPRFKVDPRHRGEGSPDDGPGRKEILSVDSGT